MESEQPKLSGGLSAQRLGRLARKRSGWLSIPIESTASQAFTRTTTCESRARDSGTKTGSSRDAAVGVSTLTSGVAPDLTASPPGYPPVIQIAPCSVLLTGCRHPQALEAVAGTTHGWENFFSFTPGGT